MRTLLFEDGNWTRLLPLSALVPVQSLRCGVLPLWRRVALHPGGGLDGLVARPRAAAAWTLEPHGLPVNPLWEEPALWLNAAVVWDGDSLAEAHRLSRGERIVSPDGDLMAASASVPAGWTDEEAGPVPALEGATEVVSEVDWPRLGAWFDLLSHAAALITLDLPLLDVEPSARPPDGVVLIGDGGLYLGAGCNLAPTCVLDTRHGPVVLGAGVEVLPHTYLQGPCFVGEGSLVRAGATLYEGCCIGPHSKVGGELEHVLLLGWANKQHEGYLGNAVIAPWVNLGAGTSNSDLKNTYGSVRTVVNGEQVGTGLTFLGCCLGEHVKTSIGTILNTGTVAGVGCNLFGSGFHPIWVPDFVWGQPGRYREYLIEKVIETARLVMGRRSVSMSPEYEDLLREWFARSSRVREEFLSRRMHGG